MGMRTKKNLFNQRGSAFLLTLFFSSLFIIMFGATLSFIMVQFKAVQQEMHLAQALNVAEAGIQYYRWHLAHSPEDFTSNTGEHTYKDPFGGTHGTFNLEVTAPTLGSTTSTITALGYPVANENRQARVRVRYGRPSLAHYAFLTNSNVWFGPEEEIKGEIHSNGGIRMDGEGDSLTTSEQLTYTCGPEHGCNNEERDGVWGSGEIQELWEFPSDHIDFEAMVLDLETMEDDAGLTLPDSENYGYFIEFSSDGTFNVNTVTSLYNPVYGYNGSAWTYESIDKQSWTPLSEYQDVSIPENGLIFVADDVWVGGEVHGRATIVAARLPDGSYPYANIYIQDDIVYVAHDGTDTLGLIAQEDVLVPLRSENKLEIDAALIAVNGHVYRYYYPKWSSEPYKTYALRDKIETYGTIITNTVWTWSWVSSETGPVVSGYKQTETTYDQFLIYSPPPSFPAEDEYAFISWEELTLTQE